ncbi:MAG: hypothetical protein IKS51_05500 [Erysipelotrichaceae bacterium]|nr:hypothetical protein [Erysipelotrichaceae bacterium]
MNRKHFFRDVFLVAVLILGHLSCGLVYAENKEVTFKIEYPQGEEVLDGLVFDFYRVADIEWDGTGNNPKEQATYLVKNVKESFASLGIEGKDVGYYEGEFTNVNNDEMSYQKLQEIASNALAIVFENEVTKTEPISTSSSLEGNVLTYKAVLPEGLYLAVARRSTKTVKTDYIITDKDSNNNTVYRTKAESEHWIYVFQPYLVFVDSMKSGTIDLDDSTIMTKYNMKVRTGKLKIEKELEAFSTYATFVFTVEWFKNYDAETGELSGMIDWKYATTDTSDLETIVENIPVGAYVRVTEYYTGAGYEPVKVVTVLKDGTIVQSDSKTRIGQDGSVVIFIDEENEEHIAKVIFTNKPSVPVFGYGFNNRFVKEDGHWTHIEEEQ